MMNFTPIAVALSGILLFSYSEIKVELFFRGMLMSGERNRPIEETLKKRLKNE